MCIFPNQKSIRFYFNTSSSYLSPSCHHEAFESSDLLSDGIDIEVKSQTLTSHIENWAL